MRLTTVLHIDFDINTVHRNSNGTDDGHVPENCHDDFPLSEDTTADYSTLVPAGLPLDPNIARDAGPNLRRAIAVEHSSVAKIKSNLKVRWNKNEKRILSLGFSAVRQVFLPLTVQVPKTTNGSRSFSYSTRSVSKHVCFLK